MPLDRLVAPSMRSQHHQGVRRYRKPGSAPIMVGAGPIDVPALRRDGTELHVSLSLTDVSASDEPSKRFVLALVRDVTAVRDAERALQRTNLAMREFVAAASHDLRTPLTSVLGFARTLQDLGARCRTTIVRRVSTPSCGGRCTPTGWSRTCSRCSQIQAEALEPVSEPVAVASVVRDALTGSSCRHRPTGVAARSRIGVGRGRGGGARRVRPGPPRADRRQPPVERGAVRPAAGARHSDLGGGAGRDRGSACGTAGRACRRISRTGCSRASPRRIRPSGRGRASGSRSSVAWPRRTVGRRSTSGRMRMRVTSGVASACGCRSAGGSSPDGRPSPVA